MSVPAPPSSESSPAAPARPSSPAPPESAFAPTVPVRASAKADPTTFSAVSTVSVPAPPVFWAASEARLIVMPASAAE